MSDPAAPPESPQRAALVHAELINVVYREYLSGSIPATAGALFLVIVMWQHVAATTLLTWLAVLYLFTAIRVILFLRFRKANPSVEDSHVWAKRHVIGSLIGGSIWGSAGVLMFAPDSIAYQGVLLTSLFAISSGAVSVFAYYLPTFYAYIVPLLVPSIARNLIEGDTVHLIIAAVYAIFLVSFIGFGRRQNRLLVESLNIRYANTDLINQLQEQTATAEKAKEEAIAANRAKSQFLAAASHDLRQPLQALRLFTEALNEKIYYPEVRSIVTNINASVEALEMLFNELLDISKLDAGVIIPKLSNFPVNNLFDQIRTDFTPQAAEKRLKLRVVPSKAIAYSDPTLLVRVLRNFVANAIRYTGEKGAILVACRRRRDGRVRIEVRDNGIGIPSEQHKKIFDEFYQLGNAERDRRKGLGLGLAIVKRIEGLVDCKVALRSVPGRGSVFSVTLPRGQLAQTKTEKLAETTKLRTNLEGVFIVVVEDQPAVREGMRVLLHEWGAKVLAVADADEAIATLANHAEPVHLIIADYRLRQETTGVEAIDKLRVALKAEVPAMLMTGNTAPDQLREAQASGYQLLHKPVPPARLRAAISALTRGASRNALPDAANG